MRCVARLTLSIAVSVLFVGAAAADDVRAARIIDVFSAVCPVHPTVDAQQAALQSFENAGLDRFGGMISGPPPGTITEHASLGEETLTIQARDGVFCLISFEPALGREIPGLLTQRFGEVRPEGDYGAWAVPSAAGEARIRYIRFKAGQTGPLWIVHGSYFFGIDAEERKDTLVLYPPERP
jgi:hypothetical protein